MTLLLDYLPIILFFIIFKIYGIYLATAVSIGASMVQIGYFWFTKHKVEPPHLITFLVLLILGGATLLSHNPIFIKWKPTVASWVLALIFLISQFVGKKTFLEYLMAKKITLPTKIWQKLNVSWFTFFAVIGVANLYVAYHYDLDTWVNFKLFGVMGATIVFGLVQSVYMSKHVKLEIGNAVKTSATVRKEP
jgi:intracellular septation protein